MSGVARYPKEPPWGVVLRTIRERRMHPLLVSLERRYVGQAYRRASPGVCRAAPLRLVQAAREPEEASAAARQFWDRVPQLS